MRGVIVNVIDFSAMENGVGRAGVESGEIARALQLQERFEILLRQLVFAKRVEQQCLEACLIGKYVVNIARGRHHVEAALRIFGGADVDVRDHRRRKSLNFGSGTVKRTAGCTIPFQ